MIPQLIERVLRRLSSGTLRLLVLAIAILLIWGTLAPVGTLIWWLDQSAENLGLKQQSATVLPADRSTSPAGIDCYIIFLPGVGDFSANQLTTGEEFFLNHLVEQHPNCVVVSDVFPYSLTYAGLGGEQVLAPLWRAAEAAKGWLNAADVLIKIRNLWRFAISADERYGSIYNRGIANTIIARMNAVYPIANVHPLKLILIGTSGGVQVALGAATYLDQWLDSQLIVVSIGGDFDGNTGFAAVDQMYHLHGRQDWIEDLSRVLFASRWPWTINSPFNQAQRQGRYSVYNTGPHAHSGEKGYFGMAVARPNTTYVELTLEKVEQLPFWSKSNRSVHCFNLQQGNQKGGNKAQSCSMPS
jgi:hypothetical protein